MARVFQIATAIVFSFGLMTSVATADLVENFDSLTDGAALSSQNGWTGPTGVQVATDPAGSDGYGFSGKNAFQNGNDNQMKKDLPSAFNDTELLTMSFDLRIDGDRNYTYMGLEQSGLYIGVERGNMTLRGANGGTKNYDHNLVNGNNNYNITAVIDPTAFGGAGSATVSFALYTAETTLGTLVTPTAFTNVQLDLDDTGKLLSNNTNALLRMHSSNGSGTTPEHAFVDNFSITQPVPVPEPSSLAIFASVGLLGLVRRRK